MPNLRGGKAYKKTKGGQDDSQNIIFIDKQEDQMIGRLVRLLGNLNAQVYCEDNKVRICKISMGIKKSVRFDIGDIILLSLRDCEVSASDLKKGIRADRGDILGKYSVQQIPQLKKGGVNPKLFAHLDTVSGIAAKVIQGDMEGADALAKADDEDMFERGGVVEEAEGEAAEIDIDAI
jgi:initiation factor 1A